MAPGFDDLSHVHEPVLVGEVLEHLLPDPSRSGVVVDGTVGGGGHAAAILEARPDVQVLGIDRDPRILVHAARRLAIFGDRVLLEHDSYSGVRELLGRHGLPAPVGVLLDLGVSSLQLDDPARGFSFSGGDVAPDMRFDPTSDAPTARDLVNRASLKDLARILREYGEEPRAVAVARAIVRARPIRTVAQLREIAQRHALRGRRHHPATRTFQALRIAVNEELEQLPHAIGNAIDVLADGGRLVVVCFHSGEERVVKSAFRLAVTNNRGHILTRKPVRPSSEEVRRNPRARPARLRALEVREPDPTGDREATGRR